MAPLTPTFLICSPSHLTHLSVRQEFSVVTGRLEIGFPQLKASCTFNEELKVLLLQ